MQSWGIQEMKACKIMRVITGLPLTKPSKPLAVIRRCGRAEVPTKEVLPFVHNKPVHETLAHGTDAIPANLLHTWHTKIKISKNKK